jgi:hypothetical protein
MEAIETLAESAASVRDNALVFSERVGPTLDPPHDSPTLEADGAGLWAEEVNDWLGTHPRESECPATYWGKFCTARSHQNG